MSIDLHVEYPLSFSDFNGNWILRQVFEKYSNIEFNKHPSSAVAEFFFFCGQTNLAELIVAFRNFANTPLNYTSFFFPKLTLCMLEQSHTVHVISESSCCHFKCQSKFSTTYGPTRPVAGSAITPPSTAASRIRSMSAGACYIGNLPSLPRDHMSSPTYSNGGHSSRKVLQLFSSKPVHLDSFSHFCSYFSVK